MSIIRADIYKGIDIGDGDPRFFVNTNEDGDASIVFVEDFHFHEQHLGRELGNKDLETARAKLLQNVPEKLDPVNTVWLGWHADGTEAFEVEIFMGNYEGLTEDRLIEDAYYFIAACVNLSDPGTFGCEYMFDTEE